MSERLMRKLLEILGDFLRTFLVITGFAAVILLAILALAILICVAEGALAPLALLNLLWVIALAAIPITLLNRHYW